MCCRGPLILRLEPDEIAPFYRDADRLDAVIQIRRAPDGSGTPAIPRPPTASAARCWDAATAACRIYPRRPQCCRNFPRKPEPGCAISGWTDADADANADTN